MIHFNRNTIKTGLLIATVCGLFLACKETIDLVENDGGNEENPSTPSVLHITSIEQLNKGEGAVNSHADVTSRSSLKMNYRTYVSIDKNGLGVDNPRYPRIKKLPNGTYILFYHNAPQSIGASIDYAVSDDLKTWTPKGKIYKNYEIIDSKGEENERRYANCDALVLSNGDLIAVVSFRANRGYREKPLDAGIELRRSTDNGHTWSEPIEIYQGVNWEPYLLELPSGEIHCYFTDSDLTSSHGRNTGTAMVVSNDNGHTWTPSFGADPYYVLRTAFTIPGDENTYFNNQMPSVIKLNNSNELAAALEANIDGYHISFAYSGEDGEWEHLAIDEEGPADRNDLAFSGSAPYLRQFPSGEAILSYNHNSRFHLKMGDATARTFGEAYSPAPFNGGYWGSLELEDSHQLIGVMPNTGEKVLTLAKFILNHRIHAVERTVNVDGDASEWADTDEALFVGEKSQAQATLRAASDKDSLYFLVEVLDEDVSETDDATLFVSANPESEVLTSDAFRINVSRQGLNRTDIYQNGWKNTDLGIVAKAAGTGTETPASDRGYLVELAIPRAELNITSEQVLLNFAITDGTAGEDAITSTTETRTAKWIPVTGL